MRAGLATTCSFPDVAFRPVSRAALDAIRAGAAGAASSGAGPPLWPLPSAARFPLAPRVQLVTLGVGKFQARRPRVVPRVDHFVH